VGRQREREVVDALAQVAADRQRLADHLPHVLDRIDPRPVVILPFDPDLGDNKPATEGERENLEIEGPAVILRLKSSRAASAATLKPLRVVMPGTSDR
jgi:hypothetical protein